MDKINKFCENKHFVDEKASLSKYGKTSKDSLYTTPFLRELQ